MATPTTTTIESDKQAVVALCKFILASLTTSGPKGRAEFLSALSHRGTACHGRGGVHKKPAFEFEDFPEGFAGRIPWDETEAGAMEEGLDGEPTVMLDHDLAMVWTPYWFRNKGVLTHVGTNCFTLLRGDWEGSGKVEWKICGMTDTARVPSEETKKRLG